MSALVSLPGPRQTSFGQVRAAPFIGDRDLPAESEVVIVGGGLIGIMTAYFLARRNIPVLVCEKAEIACEASSRAFGWVSELLLDPIKMPMTLEGKRLWRDIQGDVGEVGFRQGGLGMLAETAEELGLFEQWLESVRGIASPDNRMLAGAALARHYPGLGRPVAGAIHAPTDGGAEPIIATTVVAEAARRAGARIVTGCAVRGLDTAGGRIAGVHTERGHVRTSTVLCAANAWARLFCGNHGVDIPQVHVVMTLGRTTVTDGPPGSGLANGGGWRRMIDGSYSLGGYFGVRVPVTRDALVQAGRYRPMMRAEMLTARPEFGGLALTDLRLRRRWRPDGPSPFEKVRILGASPTAGYAEKSLRLNQEMFAEMADAQVDEEWAGIVPITPDNAPIASPVDRIGGFHVVTGASYGISWGPSLGKLMADLMTGAAPSIDPHPFRLSRFSDGSPITVRH